MSHLSDERLLALLEGDLPEVEAAEARHHLAACRACTDRRAELSMAAQLGAEAREAWAGDEAAAAIPPEVDARIRAAARSAVAPRSRRAWLAGGAVALAAAAAVVLVALPLDPSPMDSFEAAAAAGGGGLRGAPAPDAILSLQDLRDGLARRALTLRPARAEGCRPRELHRAGAFDGSGRMRAFLRRDAERLEVHLFDAEGSPVMARRLEAGAARATPIRPLRLEEAEAALSHPTCPAP